MTIEDIKKRMRYPSVDVGAGWDPIIIELDKMLSKLDPGYTVDQIKEKFGGLRYYATPSEGMDRDEFDLLIRRAEEKAARTCELCGSQDNVTTASRRPTGGWIVTQCESCRSQRSDDRP